MSESGPLPATGLAVERLAFPDEGTRRLLLQHKKQRLRLE